MHRMLWWAVALVLMTPGFSLAAVTPESVEKDDRIKTVAYDAGEVVELAVYQFATVVVEFAAYEEIEDVFAGDGSIFLIEENASGNKLFIKSTDPAWTRSNLVVETSERSYTLELLSKTGSLRQKDAIYRLRFFYPDDQLARQVAAENRSDQKEGEGGGPVPPVAARTGLEPTDLSWAYSWSGDSATAPLRVFDDGTHTYFQFARVEQAPAIFAVDPDGHEEVVNFHVEERYVVVESIERQFTLRNGGQATCIFNEGYPALPGEITEQPIAEDV